VSDCHIAALGGQYACTVHCCYLPCPRGGQPASPVPMHTDASRPLGEVVDYWMAVCGGHRPMVVHRGSFAGDDREHVISRSRDCWCAPRLLPAGTGEALQRCGVTGQAPR
jgi:hypothetical protein